jgi:hypothetical protein
LGSGSRGRGARVREDGVGPGVGDAKSLGFDDRRVWRGVSSSKRDAADATLARGSCSVDVVGDICRARYTTDRSIGVVSSIDAGRA